VTKNQSFGEKSLEDLANTTAGVTLELATGADLIDQAIALGGNLDTFNRFILDKGGKTLAQIPLIGEAARDELFNLLDAESRGNYNNLLQVLEYLLHNRLLQLLVKILQEYQSQKDF
jgi:hypothetical protein